MIDKKTLIGDNRIIDIAPSIFTTTKSPKVSNKYSFIPTIQVLEDMHNLGWEVFNATQRKSRNSQDSLFTKHMVRLRNKNIDRIGDSIPEIVLENSHDGRNAFRLHAGLFRLVCSNGLVIADTTFEQIKIKHQWYNFDEIKNVTDEKTVFDVVGPICESADFIGKERKLFLKSGDFLAIENVGAYGFVLASNYNTRPKIDEYLISDSKVNKIRDRETINQILENELKFL